MVLANWIDGWRRVWHARGVALGLYIVTFALALPLAYLVRDQIETHLGRSLVAERVTDGVDYDWWMEFTAQTSGLGTTFTPSIVGAASTLDSLSRVLDARYPPASLLWFLAAYLAVWTFLSGGIIDRYARQRRTYAHGFFGASGRLLFRLVRLSLLAGFCYWLLFRYVHPWLFLDLYRDLTRGVGVERTAFLLRLLFYLVVGTALLGLGLVFDYARIRLVVEERRSAIGALAAALRFMRRRPGAVAVLYLVNAVAWALLIATWSLVAPGIHGAGLSMWLAFAAAQLYLLLRLGIKLQFIASQTALFQNSLAHARYTAAPRPAWPESPAAEIITR
jgi:hypothetical protein